MDNSNEIGERIKQIIAAQNITQTEFAQKLNITQSMVSKICSGASEPSARTLCDICDKFGVDETWLITGIGEMFHEQTQDEKIATFMGKTLANKNSNIYKVFTELLSECTEEELNTILKLTVRLAAIEGESQKEKAPEESPKP